MSRKTPERGGNSLADLWRDRYTALLADAGFQRWASGFPLTRPMARRRTRALFDICAGFVYSQVLFACVRLNVFEILSDGPLTVDELGRKLDLSDDSTRCLVDAAVSLKLLSRRDRDRVSLGPLGAALVGNPGVAAMIEHHAILYADLKDPVQLLRADHPDTGLANYWSYAKTDRPSALAAERVAEYSTLMTLSQPFIAEEVLAAYPLSRHRCLLDVGGGEGAFLMAAAERNPALSLMLFDLPAVAERARARLAAAGLETRARTVGGSFLTDPLPAGADIVSLVRVVHDHDDADVLTLLRKVREVLPKRGTLLIAEPMSDTPGAEPAGDAYFGFYLLAMGKGRPRSPAVLADFLAQAGFGKPRLLTTHRPLLTRVMIAHPHG
ncbi:MAG: methyltransferase [Hyphomicrobiales bacterium]